MRRSRRDISACHQCLVCSGGPSYLPRGVGPVAVGTDTLHVCTVKQISSYIHYNTTPPADRWPGPHSSGRAPGAGALSVGYFKRPVRRDGASASSSSSRLHVSRSCRAVAVFAPSSSYFNCHSTLSGSGAFVPRHEIDREGQAKKDENRKDEWAEGQNKGEQKEKRCRGAGTTPPPLSAPPPPTP